MVYKTIVIFYNNYRYVASSTGRRCNGYIGACCLPNKTCIQTIKELCEHKRGYFRGEVECYNEICN